MKKFYKKWVNPVSIKPASKINKMFNYKKKRLKEKNTNPPLTSQAPYPPTPEEINNLNDFVEEKAKETILSAILKNTSKQILQKRKEKAKQAGKI